MSTPTLFISLMISWFLALTGISIGPADWRLAFLLGGMVATAALMVVWAYGRSRDSARDADSQ